MTFERSTWRANRIMKMLPDYQRYTCPARKKVRQERLKDPAAYDIGLKYKFEPYQQNGKSIVFRTQLLVTFKLH